MSVLYCEDCRLCLSACGLSVCPSTLCIDSSCQLPHCSLVNSCVKFLPLLSVSTFFTYHQFFSQTEISRWKDKSVHPHNSLRCVFFRGILQVLWHSQQFVLSGRQLQSVITLCTAVRDSLMNGIKQQHLITYRSVLWCSVFAKTGLFYLPKSDGSTILVDEDVKSNKCICFEWTTGEVVSCCNYGALSWGI